MPRSSYFILALLFALGGSFGSSQIVHAQQDCTYPSCTADYDCNDSQSCSNPSGAMCAGTCQTTAGASCQAGTCTGTGQSTCSSGQSCVNYTTANGPCSGTCQAAGSPVNSGTPTGSSPTPSGSFTPLAPIPGLTADQNGNPIDTTGPNTIPDFLNNLYKYLVGVAAILAVIMIIRGGLEISTQDSVSKKGAGREHIQQALIGLLLVLSPVLVFSIINPSILNLSLNLPWLDTKSAITNTATTTPTPPGFGDFVTGSTLYTCTSNTCATEATTCGNNTPSAYVHNDDEVCAENGGVDENGLTKSGVFTVTYSCAAGETLTLECWYTARSIGK